MDCPANYATVSLVGFSMGFCSFFLQVHWPRVPCLHFGQKAVLFGDELCACFLSTRKARFHCTVRDGLARMALSCLHCFRQNARTRERDEESNAHRRHLGMRWPTCTDKMAARNVARYFRHFPRILCTFVLLLSFLVVFHWGFLFFLPFAYVSPQRLLTVPLFSFQKSRLASWSRRRDSRCTM